MFKLMLSLSLIGWLVGCTSDTKESILASFALRMKGDLTEHHGTIVDASNISASSEDSSAQTPKYFLKLQLEDKSCILVAVDVLGVITTDQKAALNGKPVAYKFAQDALQHWPFAVFDLHRDCLPAIRLA